jgi:hypothetical protein
MNWKSLENGNKQFAASYNVSSAGFDISELTSESNLYPLEYLFLGGAMGPTTADKLETIKDGESLMKFYWKLHNAVSFSVAYMDLLVRPSVAYGLTCKTEEVNAEEPWSCSIPTSDETQNEFQLKDLTQFLSGVNQTTSTRLLGRAWTTANRFAYWLKQDTDNFEMARDKLKDAATKLKSLENRYGTQIRQLYWTVDSDQYLEDGVTANEVIAAIDKLDKAMLETNLLFSEYALNKRRIKM